MKKPDVEKILRESLNPTLYDLGFKWRRNPRLRIAHYVRTWDGGRDTLGWGIASYWPQYSVGAYATIRVDLVEDLVTPHLRHVRPDAAAEAWTCNVTDLLAFSAGPDLRPGETMSRASRMMESESEVHAFAEWLRGTVVEHLEPWWRATRTPDALWAADPKWRKFWGYPPALREIAVASLCADTEAQEAFESKLLAAYGGWAEPVRRQIESLVAAMCARRSERRA